MRENLRTLRALWRYLTDPTREQGDRLEDYR